MFVQRQPPPPVSNTTEVEPPSCRGTNRPLTLMTNQVRMPPTGRRGLGSDATGWVEGEGGDARSLLTGATGGGARSKQLGGIHKPPWFGDWPLALTSSH